MKSKGSPKVRAAVAVAVLFAMLGPKAAGAAQARRAADQRIVEKTHPDIQKIEKALAAVKKNRAAVLAVSRMVVSRSNRSLAASFPDVCHSPTPAPAAPIPYPNIAMAKDAAAGSKTAKMAEQAVLIGKESDLGRSEGDEVGTAVKKLDRKVGKILSERPLSREEQRAFRQEWTELIEKARGILRGLDQNVAEIEKLLKEAENELGIKRRQPSCSMERRRERECYSVFRC